MAVAAFPVRAETALALAEPSTSSAPLWEIPPAAKVRLRTVAGAAVVEASDDATVQVDAGSATASRGQRLEGRVVSAGVEDLVIATRDGVALRVRTRDLVSVSTASRALRF